MQRRPLPKSTGSGSGITEVELRQWNEMQTAGFRVILGLTAGQFPVKWRQPNDLPATICLLEELLAKILRVELVLAKKQA